MAIRTTALESDLTPDRLTWNLASTVGIKFSKEFALKKQAQKVKTTTADVTDNEGEGNQGGNGDNGGGGELVDDPDGD